ncbi:beta-galactosidase [Mucilaginibacter yixingensis]|uniref:Beta-galactosidase n=1 Tax=Mucilaginibacter yixingensis TaxID=1295612 RepID=A0A2T5JCQ7_9SPHI|nr:beta-galactosidase [Mucilaginibacter yixingensis]PTQ99542.1 beta-galactosidase [Mucilaginibacter yixingensis]
MNLFTKTKAARLTCAAIAGVCLLSSNFAKGQSADKFFPKSDLMTIGSYYYPEQWPRQDWERDIKKMAEVGFDFTHFGEFAWAFIEPEEGKFDFKWLDEAVELAAKNHVKVIMCTSSPTPPVWLEQKHPEILMVNADGTTMQHGSRQQCSWSSPVYREYVAKMVEAIGKHFANNKNIWGWQLDNEPSHYGQYDYSPAAQKRFQEWAKNKYQTIDALNAAWGTAFWSIRYFDWDQIRIPNGKELIAQPSPHAVLDFKRFSADECNDFLTMQYKILRKYINPNQWITTNLMPEHVDVDPSHITGLDFVTYTKYLVAGYDKGIGPQGFRMGSPTSIGFANDFFRSFNGVTGVMELQPGQVNWGKFNPQPTPGVVRMWIWHAFAGGNKFVCNYRFKQPLVGGEQYHYGIISTDGVTPSRSGEEYIKVINELKSIKKDYDPNAKKPAAYAARQAAILYNADNRWEEDNQPQTNQWNFMVHLNRYLGALQQLGAPVDVITEDKDFSKYPVMVAPSYELLDANLVARWTKYVQDGGHLVLTTRTGQKNRNAKLWEMKWAEPIYKLIGGKISFYDLLPDTSYGTLQMGDDKAYWSSWGDVLEADPGTSVWATYADQYYAGKAAVISRKLGKGTVTYVGPDADGKLEKAVLAKVYKEAGIATGDYPPGVIVQWRDGFWVGVNYGDKAYEVPIPEGKKILIGSRELKPADVVVWKD